MTSRVLYLFGCAAPPVFDVAHVIEEAQSEGWDVCLGLTPTTARWLAESLSGLQVLTGHPVRYEYKFPGEPDVWPAPDAILVAPATFNTLNQWALGLTDRLIVGIAAEAIGKGIPLAAVPCVNTAYTQHPQFERSVETLRSAGVRLLYGDGGFVPGPPGSSDHSAFPWRPALESLRPRTEG